VELASWQAIRLASEQAGKRFIINARMRICVDALKQIAGKSTGLKAVKATEIAERERKLLLTTAKKNLDSLQIRG
jgi:hypothetical protein